MSIRDRFSNSEDDVTCIGCGATVPRSEAREYDKHGDRWSRDGKRFEYLCKPCYRECCHQPRDELESTLVDASAGEVDRDGFLRRYFEIVAESAADE
ncbi:DUF7562 family protein [Halosimplex halobium]|uniref:DUF7562 family protein n=1 Tax=Halosimplex halobium TaxID=3396618 RepID=UPI003F57C1BD